MNCVRASAALVLLLAASIALADDKAAAAIQKRENAARLKCAAELVKSAKTLAGLKAFDEAREELRRAMTMAPQDAACRKEYAKLLTAKGEPAESAAEKVAMTPGLAHASCVGELGEVLIAWSQADRPEEFARLLTSAHACFDTEGMTFATFDIAWYEPYLVWARKKDVERWEKGEDWVDGAWALPYKIKELDAAHADWKSPWLLNDGIHEVRTTMPLRNAKRVLEYMRSYRRFVIDFFAGEWEWKQSKGLLPIYLTATQNEYQARIQEFSPGAPKSSASAIYLQRTGGMSPVFLTFEPIANGSPVKIDWSSLVSDLRHESAHQILFESAMAQGAGVGTGRQVDWVSEGIAEYLASHQPHEGRWRLARNATEPFATGYEPGPFAWTKEHFDKVPPLSKYFGEYKPNLDTAEEYFVATTLVYFLLVGEEGRYRPCIAKMITEVHMARGGPKCFGECFPKADLAKMQEEWKQFVASISIQTK